MNCTFTLTSTFVENCLFFIQDLQTKLEAQDRRINHEQQKEKKRSVKLQHEIEETVTECHDLTTRIKVYSPTA